VAQHRRVFGLDPGRDVQPQVGRIAGIPQAIFYPRHQRAHAVKQRIRHLLAHGARHGPVHLHVGGMAVFTIAAVAEHQRDVFFQDVRGHLRDQRRLVRGEAEQLFVRPHDRVFVAQPGQPIDAQRGRCAAQFLQAHGSQRFRRGCFSDAARLAAAPVCRAHHVDRHAPRVQHRQRAASHNRLVVGMGAKEDDAAQVAHRKATFLRSIAGPSVQASRSVFWPGIWQARQAPVPHASR